MILNWIFTVGEILSDLTRLNLTQKEIDYLTEQGYRSIATIATASHYDLGFSKDKGKRVKQSAQNIVLNDHIQGMTISDDQIVILTDECSEIIQHCIIDQFIWDTPECVVVDESHYCYIFPTTPYRIKTAKRWKVKIEAKQEEENKRNGITMDVNEIRAFARKIGFDGFWESIFQEIKGNDIMKKALSIALFSTFNEPCHICVLGSPGSSKSLSYDLITRYFPDIVPLGGNTTRSGLVINLATGELGALASSNGKVIMADEFDKIPKKDVPYIYELLSNGKCKVDSGRIHTLLESHFILIALGNPQKEVFGRKPIDQIGLPPALMSRFALIVKTEYLEPEERAELFKKKFYRDFERLQNPEKFVQWVRLARTFQPKIEVADYIVDDYIESIGKIVNGYYYTSLRRDLRMGDYLRRVPFSIARSIFSDVTEDILSQSEEIFKESIETWRK